MPGIFGRPWKTSSRIPGVVGDLAFEVRRALGGLHPQRPDPPGDTDALAESDIHDRRRAGGAPRQRAVDPGGPQGPAPRNLWTSAVRSQPSPRSGLDVEGNDRRRHVRDGADGVRDAVGGTVVEHTLQARMKRAARQQHRAFGLAVCREVGDILERPTFEPPVAALQDVERQVRETEPAPLLFQLLGGRRVDVEMHDAELVGPQRARVLHGARRRHVELSDEDDHHVALQHRRFGGRDGAGLELLLLLDVLTMKADQSEVHRRPDDGDDPCALGEFGDQQDERRPRATGFLRTR